MKEQIEFNTSEQESRRDIIAAEANKNTYFGDMEVNETSSDDEIASFLEKYQNAVIVDLEAKVVGMQKQVNRNKEEESKFYSAIADWEGKDGGEPLLRD